MPSPPDELVPEEPPSSINPYEVLYIDEKATADQIKSAYRKQALKHHPDKAPPESKETAHKKFQDVAFAYAILSDPRRRRRYDITGNTAESLDLDDDNFNWVDFFREQFSAVVSGEAIDKIKREYQGSEEERKDLLSAYERCKGDLDKVYEEVMLSDVLEDDGRFRDTINAAIRAGEVKDWPKFSQESDRKREQRLSRARREAEEAEELAEELGVGEKLNGKKKQRSETQTKTKTKRSGSNMNDLAALIQQRQKSRAAAFLDDLEAKYAPSASKSTNKGKGRKRKAGERDEDEPPEEAFLATANRKLSNNKPRDTTTATATATTETKRRSAMRGAKGN
ncbi:hypothetical protein AJ78_05689 [Emergomyces pasteurianus Ep9510]|uniref:J domain-containing protein n=1 Tax=Emergomyces pasteurianus Ep9510 TaxID=1447872 RepID=A0A1J9Q144_9EURO|nr:hypothetical protein AJ78_05689 [Emergomyces pasteurianus Ep9510]